MKYTNKKYLKSFTYKRLTLKKLAQVFTKFHQLAQRYEIIQFLAFINYLKTLDIASIWVVRYKISS